MSTAQMGRPFNLRAFDEWPQAQNRGLPLISLASLSPKEQATKEVYSVHQ